MRDRRYWLFKSEPSSFSIDDLMSLPGGTGHWDGVRNFQARNLLRNEVKVGDLVLFYHSSIPQPAIVGIAEVVRDGYPDWTAWDPRSKYFDPRSSPEHPVWYMVDVRFVRKLPQPVTLARLRTTPGLSEMVLLNRSRLSIQPVRKEEWQAILSAGRDVRVWKP